jgi:hypothetical protein
VAQPDNPGRDRRKGQLYRAYTKLDISDREQLAATIRNGSPCSVNLRHQKRCEMRCTPTSVVAPVCLQPVEGLLNRFAHVVAHLAATPT